MTHAVYFPPPKRPLGYTIEEFSDIHDLAMFVCEDLFEKIRKNKPEYFVYDSEIDEYVLRKEFHISFLGETMNPINFI